MRRLLFRMGVAVGLVLGVCGVVGRLVDPWGWAGEFHTSQCSAFQSGVESAWGKAGSFGAAGRWVVCVLGHRDSIHSRVAIG